MTTINHNLEDKVMNAIETQRVAMHPQWYFVLRATLGVVGGAIVFVALVFLVSFIMFSMRETGIGFAPGFGMGGIWIFLKAAPWLLILLSLVFLAVMQVLVRRYEFSYHRPLLISLLTIIMVTTGAGYALAASTLHPRMLESTRRDEFPVAAPLYRGYVEQKLPDVRRGEVVEFEAHGFFLEEKRHRKTKIKVTPKTRLPHLKKLEVGDRVIVVCPFSKEECRALGVKVLK